MYSSHDSDILRQQYGNDNLLRLRQETHERYSVPQIDFPAWVLSRVGLRGGEKLVDVGSGAGTYFARVSEHYAQVQYLGLDNSLGMLANHAAKGAIFAGDAQYLPLPDASFDVVMANHMLYHVPDIDQAVREFKRVLKPNGVIVTATNSVGTMPEINFLYQRALVMLSNAAHVETQLPIHSNFSLESGTRILARHFYSVVRYDMPTSFIFKTTDPLIDYMMTLRQLREPALPQGVAWDDVMLVIREQANRVIAALGELAIQKVAGVLIASDTGGITQDFVRRLKKQ